MSVLSPPYSLATLNNALETLKVAEDSTSSSHGFVIEPSKFLLYLLLVLPFSVVLQWQSQFIVPLRVLILVEQALALASRYGSINHSCRNMIVLSTLIHNTFDNDVECKEDQGAIYETSSSDGEPMSFVKNVNEFKVVMANLNDKGIMVRFIHLTEIESDIQANIQALKKFSSMLSSCPNGHASMLRNCDASLWKVCAGLRRDLDVHHATLRFEAFEASDFDTGLFSLKVDLIQIHEDATNRNILKKELCACHGREVTAECHHKQSKHSRWCSVSNKALTKNEISTGLLLNSEVLCTENADELERRVAATLRHECAPDEFKVVRRVSLDSLVQSVCLQKPFLVRCLTDVSTNTNELRTYGALFQGLLQRLQSLEQALLMETYFDWQNLNSPLSGVSSLQGLIKQYYVLIPESNGTAILQPVASADDYYFITQPTSSTVALPPELSSLLDSAINSTRLVEYNPLSFSTGLHTVVHSVLVCCCCC